MCDIQGGDEKINHVADDWEEAGDEVSVQIEQRQKVILMKKRKEETLAKVREEQMQSAQSCSCADDKPAAFKILQRPQSCDKLPSSSSDAAGNLSEQVKTLTLQEREAAYLQARERIFGGTENQSEDFDPEIDVLPIIVPLPSEPQPLSDVRPIFVACPRPRMQSVPRPRAPVYQPGSHNQNITYAVPPPTYPSMMQQKIPLMSLTPQFVPYFDSRIPPPPPQSFSLPTQNLVVNQSAALQQQQHRSQLQYFNDANIRATPAPYGRPPTQLLGQNQFISPYNPQSGNF